MTGSIVEMQIKEAFIHFYQRGDKQNITNRFHMLRLGDLYQNFISIARSNNRTDNKCDFSYSKINHLYFMIYSLSVHIYHI